MSICLHRSKLFDDPLRYIQKEAVHQINNSKLTGSNIVDEAIQTI
jgi:hypothetical protein